MSEPKGPKVIDIDPATLLAIVIAAIAIPLFLAGFLGQ